QENPAIPRGTSRKYHWWLGYSTNSTGALRTLLLHPKVGCAQTRQWMTLHNLWPGRPITIDLWTALGPRQFIRVNSVLFVTKKMPTTRSLATMFANPILVTEPNNSNFKRPEPRASRSVDKPIQEITTPHTRRSKRVTFQRDQNVIQE